MGLNEKVLVFELGYSFQNLSVLETEVFTSLDSTDAKLRFQPSTIQAKKFKFRIIRLLDSKQQSNTSFDLALLNGLYGVHRKLDFEWTVVGRLSPRIISASAYKSVRIDIDLFCFGVLDCSLNPYLIYIALNLIVPAFLRQRTVICLE